MSAQSTTSSRDGIGSGQDPLRAREPGPPRDPALPAEQAGDTLINDAVSLLDGVVEYLGAIFRLERHRLETRTRRFVQKAIIVVSGAAVLLLGIVFLSVGVSSLLSEALQAPFAGPLIVGGVYALGGVITILVAARRKES